MLNVNLPAIWTHRVRKLCTKYVMRERWEWTRVFSYNDLKFEPRRPQWKRMNCQVVNDQWSICRVQVQLEKAETMDEAGVWDLSSQSQVMCIFQLDVTTRLYDSRYSKKTCRFSVNYIIPKWQSNEDINVFCD